MPPSQMSTIGAQGTRPGVNPSMNTAGPSGGFKGKVSGMASYIQTNPATVKIMGGVGGLALTAISILSCFAIFNSFLAPLTYIQNIFFLIFGLIITWVSFFPESNISQTIYNQANFLSTLAGRGIFFLYLGALLFGSGLSGSSPSVAYLIVGSWLLICSVVYFIVRCRQPSEHITVPSAQVSGV